jgi:squalene-hopene/tetraprenyl-beta-curcumene cyclase
MDNERSAANSARFSRRKFTAAFSAAVASAAAGTAAAHADIAQKSVRPSQLVDCVGKGIEYLETHGQAGNGAFGTQAGVGVTALVATALLRHGRSVREPVMMKALRYIESLAQPDGGIYSADGMLANYETCLAIMCLGEAHKDRYAQLLSGAEAFIRGQQWDESKGKDRADVAYGGAGYGKHKRPDLSNTTFLMDALKSCGRGADDPAVQKALIFVSRCQNLESKHNTTPFAAKNPDGGFYYTVAAGGSSAAGATETGGLRSYASMTYSGLKSMIYAGLGPNDRRIIAAMSWLRANYDLQSNPGLGQSGLYYYYHVFAKTLHALGDWSFEDNAGQSHDWRSELAAELVRRQRTNGSWANENDRWMEGDPNLVTAYALLALSYCRAQA